MAAMYAGKILRIDLTTGEVKTVPTEPYAKDYLGCKGIGIRILYEEVGPDVDPMSSDNLLSFDTGPFTGSSMPGSSRCHVTAKSPLTGLLGVSNFGGYFAAELKLAGYDHVVVKRRSARPVYIAIQDGDVSIRDASGMWGKDTVETPKLLRKGMGEYDIKWACIGPAGENLVRYASIISSSGNGAGRTGMGCVMGSKNLKAVAVRGTGSVRVADPERFLDLSEWCYGLLKAGPSFEKVSHMGDRRSLDNVQKGGAILVKNATTTGDTFYDDEVSGEKFYRENAYQRAGCFNCPVRCMEYYRVPDIGDVMLNCQVYQDLTAPIGLKNRNDWYQLALMHEKYGYDCTSLGAMMGWATELFQRGIITENDTDGLKLEWNDGATFIRLAEKIARREGFGDVLANDPISAAARIGRDSIKYLMHSKGSPQFGLNSRNLRGMALGTAVGPRGDVIRGIPFPELVMSEVNPETGYTEQEFHDALERYGNNLSVKIAGTAKAAMPMEYEGKAEIIAYYEDTTGVTDLTGTCKWQSEWCDQAFSPDVQARMLSAGLGREVTTEDLFTYQRRARSLERAYDCREGIDRAQDTLPDRYFDEAMAEGKYKGDRVDRAKFEAMKDRYYAIRGWDLSTGAPSRKTLESLGMKDVADDLESKASKSIAKETAQAAVVQAG